MTAVWVIGDRPGAVLDDAIADGLLPTVLLGDDRSSRQHWPGGRGRGVVVFQTDGPDPAALGSTPPA